jgi:hypothetical protein
MAVIGRRFKRIYEAVERKAIIQRENPRVHENLAPQVLRPYFEESPSLNPQRRPSREIPDIRNLDPDFRSHGSGNECRDCAGGNDFAGEAETS